jgi:arylsulfatase A-like enzyme
MWWPGTIPAGTTCDTLATTMDLLPTLASLGGGQAPRDRTIDGHDITNLVLGEGPQQTPYEAFYYYDTDTLHAVRQGRWKLFLPLEDVSGHPHFRPGEGDQPLLFDVVADVGCDQDVAADHPEVVARLRRLAEVARADLGDQGEPGPGVRPRGFLTNP